MRIKITLSAHKPAIVDFNYQHQIQSLIYEFLSRSNPDYAQWLHQQGFVYKRDKRFKFFVFSGILFHGPIKLRTNHATHPDGLSGLNCLNRLNGFSFHASQTNPFTFSFCIASPVDMFIQHLIEGVFSEGQEVRLGKNIFSVYRIETLPELLNDLNRLNCLNDLSRLVTIKLRPLESPIFVKKPMPPGQHDIFLFPGDKEYENLLNQNLKDKYETLYGKPYENEMLTFDFYTIKGKSVKHFTVFKKGVDGALRAINIKGMLQPFTVTGAKELIQIGTECGFGQNNSMGCGYVALDQTGEIVQTVQNGLSA